jgi:hypothetical protein
MLRTRNLQPSLWDSVLPEVCLRPPAELERVDAWLDDEASFCPVPGALPIGRPARCSPIQGSCLVKSVGGISLLPDKGLHYGPNTPRGTDHDLSVANTPPTARLGRVWHHAARTLLRRSDLGCAGLDDLRNPPLPATRVRAETGIERCPGHVPSIIASTDEPPCHERLRVAPLSECPSLSPIDLPARSIVCRWRALLPPRHAQSTQRRL